jgi:hypothetical protein
MIIAPPVVPGVQLKLAVVNVIPALIGTRFVGALGTTGMKTVEPVPAGDISDVPIILVAVILATIGLPEVRKNGLASKVGTLMVH